MRTERVGFGARAYLGLHGWNGSRHTFRPLTGHLPEDISFLSVDLPGCGDSPPPRSWDLECIVAEIAGQLDRPTTLVGNCSGAILALLLARRVPSRVERVVMIDAFAWWPWYFRLFLSRSIGRRAYNVSFGNPVGRWITNAALRGKRAAGTDLTRGFETADHQSTYRYLTMLADAGTARDYAGLTAPVDILYGAKSFAAVRRSAGAWAEIWPDARTFALEGAGHLPILEAAPQVRAILFGENSCRTPPHAHLSNSTH